MTDYSQENYYDDDIFPDEEDEGFAEDWDDYPIALNCWNCGVLLTEENRSNGDPDLCADCAANQCQGCGAIINPDYGICLYCN